MTRIIVFEGTKWAASFDKWPPEFDLPVPGYFWHTGDWFANLDSGSGEWLETHQVPANLRAIVLLLT